MQFMASVFLIAGTLIVYRQLHYMMKSDLGMNIDQVMVIERPGIADTSNKGFNSAIDVFRHDLTQDPSVEAVTASLTVPGKQREYKVTVKKNGASGNDSAIVRVNTMDYDFLDVYKMKLLAGRNFSKDFPKDPDTSLIITESAARLVGFKSPADAIGKTLLIPEFGGAAVNSCGSSERLSPGFFKKATRARNIFLRTLPGRTLFPPHTYQ